MSSDSDWVDRMTGGLLNDTRSGVPDTGFHGTWDSTPDDREDNLRVTALELAIKHCPDADAEDVIKTADRFRAFLAGNGPAESDVLTWSGYGPGGFVERIDMDATAP